MQRYNIFLQVHKGLRAMLYHSAGTLQQTDFTDAEETGKVFDQVLETIDLFDKHAVSADNFILSAIGKYEPDIAGLFKKVHVEDHELSSRIRVLLNIFYYTTLPAEKNILGSAIRFAFVEFLVFNLRHMAREEDVLNNLLWKYYTDEQLMTITQKIVADIPKDMLDNYGRWMMVGLNNIEIINWLKTVRETAPAAVFDGLLSLAENVLAKQRWERIKEALPGMAMVA